MSESQKLQQQLQLWEKEVLQPFQEKNGERKGCFKSINDFEIQRLYTPANAAADYEKLGFPGQFPFTRGIYPNMYRGRLWTMRQYAGFGTAEQTNERFRFLLEKGQTGLSTAFDLPTQMGYDSDAEQALGEVGRVGVAVDTIEDMRLLMRGIDQSKVSTSMTINATAMVLLALYLTVADEKGVSRKQLAGTVQNDILKEYVARGTYIFPPEPSMRIITDMFAFCSREMPRFNPISISGYHIREAGASAVEEVAFTLSHAIAYVEAALRANLDVDQFAPRLSFFFNAHNGFFEEIAKFRAARRLWARIMKKRFHAKNPKSMLLRFHAQTGGSTLTAQQPENNIVRVTLQALAAVLGGCQSLHCNAMDEALSIPSEKAAQIALRTQQVIAKETGVADTVDPCGGSYFLEHLTDKIEYEASRLIEEVENMGGAVKAIEAGFIQKRIQESAYRFQQKVEEGEYEWVGVNCYQNGESLDIELLEVDPELERKQVERLTKFKKARSQIAVERAKASLRRAAEGKDNLMPYILDCVRGEVTLGEICDTLRAVFRVFQPPHLI